MRREGTHAHENRELDWARWVRRAAADICALRRSAPTWAPAPSLFSEQSLMPGEGTQVHENRELDWARWVRRAAADICALRRSAPTWAPAPSLFSEQPSCARRAPMHMKTESWTGRGGSAAPRRTFARSGGARPLGPQLPAYFRSSLDQRKHLWTGEGRESNCREVGPPRRGGHLRAPAERAHLGPSSQPIFGAALMHEKAPVDG